MPNANPDVTAALRAAGVTAGLTPERLLLVGQIDVATASVTPGELVENIPSDEASINALFGENSALAGAVRRARRRNSVTPFDAIGLDDAGGATDATGTVTFTGTATTTGTLLVTVGSEKDNTYSVAVASGDTATVVGATLVAAIVAQSQAYVTAVNAVGVVTLTAVNGGTFGNTIGVYLSGSVAGITTAVAAMSGGATDPVLTGVFDVIGSRRYQGIAWQFADSTTALTDLLDPRFNPTNNVLDGRGFTSKTDTFANHLTTLGAFNSQSLCANTDNLISAALSKGPAVREVPFIKAAEFAAIRALRRTDGAILGSLVTARSARDSFGGPHTNSKPYFNTPFPDLRVPAIGDSFTETEIRQLEAAGGWVIDANRAYTAVIAGRVVTTYKTDPAGNPDPTFGPLNFVDTSTAAREFIVNNTRAKYVQYRAASGALLDDMDSANEASVAAFVAELNGDLGGLGLVNTGTGTVDGETIDFDKLFREGLTVSLNPVTGKFAVAFKLQIIVQLTAVSYDLAVAFEV